MLKAEIKDGKQVLEYTLPCGCAIHAEVPEAIVKTPAGMMHVLEGMIGSIQVAADLHERDTDHKSGSKH